MNKKHKKLLDIEICTRKYRIFDKVFYDEFAIIQNSERMLVEKHESSNIPNILIIKDRPLFLLRYIITDKEHEQYDRQNSQ